VLAKQLSHVALNLRRGLAEPTARRGDAKNAAIDLGALKLPFFIVGVPHANNTVTHGHDEYRGAIRDVGRE